MKSSEQYWIERGKSYKAEFRRHNPLTRLIFRLQERAIRQELRSLDGVESVLEVGCGFGRITKILLEDPKVTRIVATDISSDQITRAKEEITDQRVEFRVVSVLGLDYYREFDLVIASEVLMHMPPDKIELAIYNMHQATKKYCMNIDWCAPGEALEVGGYCWQHDYHTMLIRRLYRQAIFLANLAGR